MLKSLHTHADLVTFYTDKFLLMTEMPTKIHEDKNQLQMLILSCYHHHKQTLQ